MSLIGRYRVGRVNGSAVVLDTKTAIDTVAATCITGETADRIAAALNLHEGAVEALRALEHGWKHFYDNNVGTWSAEHDGDPLTLANYVRHHLEGGSGPR